MPTYVNGVEQPNPELMKKLDELMGPSTGWRHRLKQGRVAFGALVGISGLLVGIAGLVFA